MASKALFSIAIIVDFVALFVDLWGAWDVVKKSEPTDDEERLPKRRFRRVKVDCGDFLIIMTVVLFMFMPRLVVCSCDRTTHGLPSFQFRKTILPSRGRHRRQLFGFFFSLHLWTVSAPTWNHHILRLWRIFIRFNRH